MIWYVLMIRVVDIDPGDTVAVLIATLVTAGAVPLGELKIEVL